MASTNILSSQLRLKFETGYDEFSGDAEYKSKTFNNVDGSATSGQLYAVAVAFASLQKLPLGIIERIDQSEVYEE